MASVSASMTKQRCPRARRYPARLHRLAPGARPAWPPRGGGAGGLIAKQPVDPERLDLDFGMDPIGALASRGDLAAPWPEIAGRVLCDGRRICARRHFAGPFMRADGRIWHDAGATEAQELGFVLATGVAYLRALETLPDDALARAVGVTLAADQDMFLTLAKFRAMRLLVGAHPRCVAVCRQRRSSFMAKHPGG